MYSDKSVIQMNVTFTSLFTLTNFTTLVHSQR